MAIDSPDADEYDRPDFRLSPEMHKVQAEMAAERGEKYDPVAVEEWVKSRKDQWPDLDAAEPLPGQEDRHEEWLAAGEDS